MIHIENVRTQLAYKPFRPFWLETIGGTKIRVQRAEWFYEVPGSFGKLFISDSESSFITYWGDLIETIEIETPLEARSNESDPD
jgi:hypothetical protein